VGQSDCGKKRNGGGENVDRQIHNKPHILIWPAAGPAKGAVVGFYSAAWVTNARCHGDKIKSRRRDSCGGFAATWSLQIKEEGRKTGKQPMSLGAVRPDVRK